MAESAERIEGEARVVLCNTTPCILPRCLCVLMRVYSSLSGIVACFFTQLRAVKLPSFLKPASSARVHVEPSGKTFSA